MDVMYLPDGIPRSGIPQFVVMFDRVLSQIAQLDREHWTSALVMFKIMLNRIY